MWWNGKCVWICSTRATGKNGTNSPGFHWNYSFVDPEIPHYDWNSSCFCLLESFLPMHLCVCVCVCSATGVFIISAGKYQKLWFQSLWRPKSIFVSCNRIVTSLRCAEHNMNKNVDRKWFSGRMHSILLFGYTEACLSAIIKLFEWSEKYQNWSIGPFRLLYLMENWYGTLWLCLCMAPSNWKIESNIKVTWMIREIGDDDGAIDPRCCEWNAFNVFHGGSLWPLYLTTSSLLSKT